MKNKGFTLIELLVVIAIIGILSSVVLASLNTARSKGKDASATGSLSSLRAESEIIFSDTNSYATVCTATSTKKLIASAVSQTGKSIATDQSPGCQADASSWAVSGQLTSGKYFCVDYSGNATTTAAGTISATPFTCQ